MFKTRDPQTHTVTPGSERTAAGGDARRWVRGPARAQAGATGKPPGANSEKEEEKAPPRAGPARRERASVGAQPPSTRVGAISSRPSGSEAPCSQPPGPRGSALAPGRGAGATEGPHGSNTSVDVSFHYGNLNNLEKEKKDKILLASNTFKSAHYLIV